MKFDSPLFDRIRVKPGQDRTVRVSSPVCDWPGCEQSGTHRAPKGRGREGEHWRYCLDHVREYNQSYNYFAGMSDDEIRALFPGDAGNAYVKDGKASEANDPADRVKDGNYVRPLNDYAVLFRNYLRLRSQYVDLIAAAKQDKLYIENALADTKQDEQFRRQEIEDLKVQLAK